MERNGHFRRGTSLLPSLFTTGNLFLGFWSIVKTLDGKFETAAPLIGGAVVLDMLDGRIARLTGTQSEFGAQLDSLADAVSFGVAPALLAYVWALSLVPRAGWPAAFLFLVCGVMRLARFNVQRTVVDSRYFVGLPIPAGAAQVAAIVFVLPDPPSPAQRWEAIAMLVAHGRPRLPDGQHLPLPLVQELRPAAAAQLHDRARRGAAVPADRGAPRGLAAGRDDDCTRCPARSPGRSAGGGGASRRQPVAAQEPQPAP